GDQGGGHRRGLRRGAWRQSLSPLCEQGNPPLPPWENCRGRVVRARAPVYSNARRARERMADRAMGWRRAQDRGASGLCARARMAEFTQGCDAALPPMDPLLAACVVRGQTAARTVLLRAALKRGSGAQEARAQWWRERVRAPPTSATRLS